MAKAKASKKGSGAATSPYDKPSKKNNVFAFNTNVGQHILKNPGVADAIVAKAEIRPNDTVLEIGPGTGNITVRLLERARRVVAIELDTRMGAEVQKRVQGGPLQNKLELMLGDAIKAQFPAFDVCVSNTPYAISSPLVFKLLALPNWRVAILMFQREFALRLTARPGDALYCRLSVNAQFFAKITHVLKVGKNNFKPAPQVESSVVKIEPKSNQDRPQVDFDEWDSMLRVSFNRKNKTLRAAWNTKEVIAVLTRNYQVYCSMNSIPLLEDGIGNEADVDGMEVESDLRLDDGDEEEDNTMDVDDIEGDEDTPSFFAETAAEASKKTVAKTPSKRKRSKAEQVVRDKLEKVLVDTELADKRARQCDENDFLRLLYAVSHPAGGLLIPVLALSRGLTRLRVSQLNEQGLHFS